MRKRTIVVLAVLSMVVALIPGVALAIAAPALVVQVTVSGQDIDSATLTIGKATLTHDTIGAYASGKQLVTFEAFAGGDYNGDGTAAGGEVPLNPTSGAITATAGGTTYHGTVTINDIDGDGTAGEGGPEAITFSLPSSLSLSGQVVEDQLNDPGVAAKDNKVSPLDPGLSGTAITIYKSGVKFASTVTTGAIQGTGGSWTAIVGAGSFTVQADVEGASGGIDGPGGDFYDDDACDADHAAADCVATPTDIDEGEVQWFGASATAAGATQIHVNTSLSGVNIVYDNDSGINSLTWDHIDVYVGTFNDTAGHWADSYIARLTDGGVITGCTTTLFCPEATITRAEFAVMVQRATGRPLSVVTSAPFSDVPTSYWAAAHIQDLKALKVVEGSGAAFNPEAPISRGEAVEIIARAALLDVDGATWRWPSNPGLVLDSVLMANAAPMDVLTTADLPAPTLAFSDVPTTYWATRAIHWLVDAGVVWGNTDGTFGPEDNLTRAEMAALLSRALRPYIPD